MSQTTKIRSARSTANIRIVGAVSAAHFVSHYYIILLAPLLPFVRAEYDVSYTEIGLAFAVFNGASAALQTPTGFLVDRLSARMLLIAGLVIGSGAFVIAGIIDSYWGLVAMFALAGVGNTVYHPADYALLSHYISSKHIGQAFSVHTFAGMLGAAVAPATLLAMHSLWGWRGAFIGAGLLGFAVAGILAAIGDNGAMRPSGNPTIVAPGRKPKGWQLLLSAPVLLNMVFFLLLATISSCIMNYSVVALGALYGTRFTSANAALSAYLLLSAVGVLIGGLLVARITRYQAFAATGLAAIAALTTLIAYIDLGSMPLIAVMSLNGFCFGVIMPSRDMLVQAITPSGSFGKVFGFVTTGFNIGGIIAPLIFGAVMDHGSPRLVFLLAAACSLFAMATLAVRPRRAAASKRPIPEICEGLSNRPT